MKSLKCPYQAILGEGVPTTSLAAPVGARGGVSRSPGRTRGGVQALAISPSEKAYMYGRCNPRKRGAANSAANSAADIRKCF